MLGQSCSSGAGSCSGSRANARKRSVVPATVLVLQLLRWRLLVLAYGIYAANPVIIIGQFGMFIYARNLYFLMARQRADRDNAGRLPGQRRLGLRLPWERFDVPKSRARGRRLFVGVIGAGTRLLTLLRVGLSTRPSWMQPMQTSRRITISTLHSVEATTADGRPRC